MKDRAAGESEFSAPSSWTELHALTEAFVLRSWESMDKRASSSLFSLKRIFAEYGDGREELPGLKVAATLKRRA